MSAPSPIADLSDSLLAWASSTELDLARRLGELPGDPAIFVRLDITGDELERLTTFYGTFLSRQIAAGGDEAALLATCPALTATTLLFRAARLNTVEELSAEFWSGLGLAPTADRLVLVAPEKYTEILTRAGLDPVDTAATGSDGETGRLFAHVGLATDWIPELIELIETRRLAGTAVVGADGETDADAEAAALVAVLAEESRQAGPLCAVLPDLAAELIAPVIRLVGYAATHPGHWRQGLRNGVAAGVPPLILEDIVEELSERPAGTTARRHRVGVGSRENQPRLSLDLARQRVVLRLPEVLLEEGEDPEVRWHIDVEGRPTGFRTRRADSPGRPVTGTLDIPVRRPVREVGVRDLSHDDSWIVPGVDESDPVLVFTRRGKDLTERVSLHHDSVLVVCPVDATAVDAVRNEVLPVRGEWRVKAWEGWVIRELDLTDAVSLHIDRPGVPRPAMGQIRCVDPRQRVVFHEPDEPAPGVRSLGGLPVHTESLQAVFPPTVSGAPEIWFLSVSSWAGPEETGEEVTEEEPLEVPADGGLFDVFDPDAYDTPWVGEYLVRLRGPRNESFRHEYAIVEDLHVEAPDAPRLARTAGLSPVTVSFRGGDKPLIIARSVDLGPMEKQVRVIAETGAGDALPLIVEPPRLRYQLPLVGEDPMWRTEAVVIAAGSVDTSTRFRIRPGLPVESPRLVVRDHHGAPVRTLRLGTVDEVTWSISLTPLAGSLTLLREGSCELEFIADGRSHSVRLATLRPSVEFTAELVDGLLTVTPAPQVGAGRPVGGWIWQTTAPWQSATSVTFDIPEGKAATATVQLPENLVDAGPLAVQLFNGDRFTSLYAPATPGPAAIRVAAPGYARPDGGGPWTRLSAFLAGESDEAPDDIDVLTTLWDVLAGWLSDGAPDDAGEAMRTALARHPREALQAMSRSLVPSTDRPAQFILSGLVHATLRTDDAVPEPGVAWIAALEILGELAATDDEDTAGRREIGKRLTAVGGAELARTVESGRDATLETSCIDATTVQIAQLSPEQQEAVLAAFFAGSNLVPGALSEENSRLIAVFETFRRRTELNSILADPELLRVALTLLRRIRQTNRQLFTSARVRFDKLDNVDTDNPDNRWALAPVISMILAMAARLRAHGRLGSPGQLTSAYAGWAQLARVVPDLITGDLVAADAMVLGVFGPDDPESGEDAGADAVGAESALRAVDLVVGGPAHAGAEGQAGQAAGTDTVDIPQVRRPRAARPARPPRTPRTPGQ
ncbi:hypothetical protein [Corynebacterium terpenotabidum]|uniref:Uncharacterized protein n=1 Tax=Corynebacterium terpenotabidum Y-11 TaxID=1200352 RepID=S4XD23_9CORY|nr:hypothetical protein [Corynebacterium terpenotabidum]AGP31037.1 hypothetical protein A606_06950 [Corynebacterium terpenotabidum Y-11]